MEQLDEVELLELEVEEQLELWLDWLETELLDGLLSELEETLEEDWLDCELCELTLLQLEDDSLELLDTLELLTLELEDTELLSELEEILDEDVLEELEL